MKNHKPTEHSVEEIAAELGCSLATAQRKLLTKLTRYTLPDWQIRYKHRLTSIVKRLKLECQIAKAQI